MSQRINFTKSALVTLLSATPRTAFLEVRTRGLMVLVTKGGSKSFYVRRKVDGRSERIFIVRFPEWTV